MRKKTSSALCRKELEDSLEYLVEQRAIIQNKINEINNSITKEKGERISKKIKELGVTITDHFKVRFMERVFERDLAFINEAILCEENLSLLETLGGNLSLPFTYDGQNFIAIIRNYKFVTVKC